MLSLIRVLKKRVFRFIFSYGKKWWFGAILFLSLYMVTLKTIYPFLTFDVEKMISFLFSVTYPAKDFQEFAVPYLWIIFQLFSIFGVFFSVVDLLEKQSTSLLIRIKSKRILSCSLLISVLEVSFLYVLIFHFLVSIVVMNHSFLTLSIVKYFILLWLTVTIVNYLCLVVYLLFHNSVISLLASSVIITIASLMNFKYFPLKNSLILNGQFNQYLNTDSYILAILSSVIVLVVLVGTIDFLMKKHTF